MSEYVLEVKNLSVQYKTDLETVYAVNDISFSLKKGQTIGIVGETGAGKTTTALAILKLLPERISHTQGEIFLNGKDILTLSDPEIRKIRGNKIAMIFQDPMTSLNPVMTIGDQIYEALSFHKPPGTKNDELEKRVDEVLTLVGISPVRKGDYPHQFSGGMKQRVVIAMALACEPEILIADEPTTALDVTIQAQVLSMISDIQLRLNTSMIMITHDLGVVAKTCDYVVIMYAGELIETGTAEDIFCNKHHHPYTEGLFGSIPNLKVHSKRLNPIPGLMPDPSVKITGCKFADRCPKAMDVCTKKHPQDHVFGSHTIKCHLFDQSVSGKLKEAYQ